MKRRYLILATALLLLAAGLRLWHLGTLPPGFSDAELDTLSITRLVRSGQITVFHQTRGGSQETLFHIIQAVATSLSGEGLITSRLPAVGAGLITLALLYALTRRLYGARAGLFALGLMAVSFWPVLLARLSLRETLVPFFTLAVLLALARAFHLREEISPDPPNTAAYGTLGVLTATSLYAHWFGLFLAAAVTLSVLYLFLTRQRISRRAAASSAFAVLVSIIITVPYLVTTLRAPEGALATLRADLTVERLPQSLLDGLAAIFWRGDTNAALNLPGRPLLDPISGLFLLLGLGVGLREWRRPSRLIPALAALVGLIPALLSAQGGSFLALSGALPLLYMLIARGADTTLDWLVQRRPTLQRAAPRLLATFVAASLLWSGLDLFRAWPGREDVKTVYHASRGLLAHHLDRTAAALPTIVCSPQLQDTTRQPGDLTLLPLMMQRENVPLRYLDCANGLIIAEGGVRQQFAFTDLTIIERMHGVLYSWLRDRPVIPVAGLEPGSVLELDVERQLENTIGRLLTTAPTAWAPEASGGPGLAQLPVRMGGNLTFLGYVPERELLYHPGDVVTVLTYWRVDGAVPPDLRILMHLLADPGAAPVAQSQAINVWTPSLHSRDVFVQINYLVLPSSTPAGSYDISAIAYQAESQRRLPVFDGERVRGDRLILYQITVSRE